MFTNKLFATNKLFTTIAVIGIAILSIAMLAVGWSLYSPSNAQAAGILTLNSVQLTSDAAGATSVSGAVSFKTATTGTIATIVVGLPQFSGASPSVSNVSGIGAGTVASGGSGATYAVTYTVTTPASVNAATTISFTIGNLTNPAATGNQIVSLTTKTSVPATIDAGTTLVSILTNAATTLTANVAQALTASIGGTGSVTLNVDPSGTAFELSSGYTVSVASNAKNGVTTTSRIGGQLTGSAYNTSTIPTVAGTFASPTSNTGKPPVNTWGINADGTDNTWAGPTTTGIPVTGLTTSGPTNQISQTHTIGVNVDYTTPADTYTTTVYYIFTPNY